jgi:hypothetical protein
MAVVQDLERVTAFGTAGWVSPERELACSSFREAFLASLHDSFLVMGMAGRVGYPRTLLWERGDGCRKPIGFVLL